MFIINFIQLVILIVIDRKIISGLFLYFYIFRNTLLYFYKFNTPYTHTNIYINIQYDNIQIYK